MFYGQSTVPYVSVDDAARILRMSAWTLYRNMEDIPHIKVGPEFRIPVEFLMMEPPPIKVYGKVYQPRFYHQPFLPFEVKPIRSWRNSRRPVVLNPFGEPI